MMRHSRNSWMGGLAIFAALTLLPTFALAQTSDPGEVPARLRHFEGTVSIQRAAVGTTESALNNLPVSKGDRVWTDADGRVEIVFNDGSTLWLDHSTTIDVVSLRPRLRDPEAILRLWSGSVYLQRPLPPTGTVLKELRVDSGAGSAIVESQGLFRIDVDDQQRVWLSVYDGMADLISGGLIESLSAGEQSYAELDSAPAHSVSFNTAEQDDFADWRGRLVAQNAPTERYVREVTNYVPQEIVHHAYDLEGYGNWTYYDAYDSWGWRPTVAVGWSPYRNGRWVYSWSGWVWVPFSQWGYVTGHYGRWDYVGSNGWCWFPGRRWGPAWVQWYVSPHHVGWAPLNRYNQPVVNINVYGDVYGGVHVGGRYPSGGVGGRRPAIGPQGSASGTGKAVKGLGYTAGRERAWTFVEAGQLGARDAGKVALDRTAAVAVARSGESSRALIAGPLRARTPRNLAPASANSRTAVARSTAGPTAKSPGTRTESTPLRGDASSSGVASRQASPRGTEGAAMAGVTGRSAGSRAIPTSSGAQRPASPMARGSSTSRQGSSAARALPRGSSAAGRTTTQAGTRAPSVNRNTRTASPRAASSRSSSAPPASRAIPSSARRASPTRSQTMPGSRPPSVGSRTAAPRGSSTVRSTPSRPSTGRATPPTARPGTGSAFRSPSRPSGGRSSFPPSGSTVRSPSSGSRTVAPRGSRGSSPTVSRPSVARPSAGARVPRAGSARPSGGGSAKPSGGGSRTVRKAKPKGG
jgi:hypothetical protein